MLDCDVMFIWFMVYLGHGTRYPVPGVRVSGKINIHGTNYDPHLQSKPTQPTKQTHLHLLNAQHSIHTILKHMQTQEEGVAGKKKNKSRQERRGIGDGGMKCEM
jgi:hypothetical protein